VRTEVDAEQFLKLLDLDAPEFTPILLINLGHLLQAGCTGDDLVDRRTQMRLEYWCVLLQNRARTVVDVVVGKTGGQLRSDWGQRHGSQPSIDQKKLQRYRAGMVV